MKSFVWLWATLLLGGAAQAQPNPLAYPPGSSNRLALELCYQAMQSPQGSRTSQALLDSATRVLPTLAWAWAEQSVPYLKRGEFKPWYALLGHAVELAPTEWLGYRAGCRFEWLHDYVGALRDLAHLRHLRPGQAFVGYDASGDYDLRIVQALCERETGQQRRSLATFAACLADNEQRHRVGLYDYLHYGVTQLFCKQYNAARRSLLRQVQIYPKLADTYYYLGLVAQQSHAPTQAHRYFMQAYALYTRTGYRHRDIYNTVSDQVFLSDINKQLAD